MENGKIKEKIYAYYDQGFHCAEAIFNLIQELHSSENCVSCRVASGFCGGIGKSGQDVCGALAGGVMALGNIYGREKGAEDINRLVALSAELRQRFLNRFKSTVCREIKSSIAAEGTLTGINNCRDVTAETAALLHRLIKGDES